ncbi:MAG TPA: hypothetical protein VD770_05195 [Coxiellaceae bacterium]|nr:hypothetical protein [Coxiellaceae bacterium]
MQRKSKSNLLKELKTKEEILKARIANLEIRQRKEEDRILTRKKILIGAHILEKIKNDESAQAILTQELDQFLIRPYDRKLFDLPMRE